MSFAVALLGFSSPLLFPLATYMAIGQMQAGVLGVLMTSAALAGLVISYKVVSALLSHAEDDHRSS